jgi:putative copper export protein
VLLVCLTGLIGTQILCAVPANAHGGAESVLELSAPVRVARVVAIVAAVVVAGAALLRPVAGPPSEAARRVTGPAAAASALAALIGALAGLPPLSLLGLGALTLIAAAAAFAATPAFAMLGGGAVVGWLCRDAISDGVRPGALMVGHVGVAAVWVGAVLAVATAAADRRGRLVRRLGPYAVAAGVSAAATGVLSAREYNLTISSLTVTDFGRLVVLKAVLLLAVAGLGLIAHCAVRARAAGGFARAELVASVLALVAGGVLTGLPAPGPTPTSGVPLARRLLIGDAVTGLMVVPQRPGPNLVHLMTDRFTDLVVDGRRYPAQARPGADGMWAQIQLPAGHSRIEVHQGRHMVQQVLNAGSTPVAVSLTGPDAPECAASALGALLGGSESPLTVCPHQILRPADADALRATVLELVRRGARSATLITDDTPRGRAAAGTVRSAAAAAGMPIRNAAPAADVVIATAGWAVTDAALRDRSGREPLYGTYLAPWLMQAEIVAAAGGAPLAVLPFDPLGPVASAYVAALRQVAPSQSASAAGLSAFRAARGDEPGRTALTLYVATPAFSVMPSTGGGGGSAHHSAAEGWLLGGPLTPIGEAPARSPSGH